MTYIVPNYFLEEQPNAVISSDSLFTLAYSSKKTQENIAVRNTTHVMILITSGSKILTSKNEKIHLYEGDILLLTQGNYFMSEAINSNGLYAAMMVYFDDEFMMKFINKYATELNKSNPKDVIFFSSNKFLKSLIDSFSLYMHNDLEQKNEIIKLKTEEIFLYLLSTKKEMFSTYLQAIKFSAKDRIRYILEANLDLIKNVDDMCSLTRVSKAELRISMKKSFGLHPKAWLAMKRLEQASLLLKNSDETISSIATTCGYASISWFGVQFKEAYHVTPKVYREQNL